MPDHPRFLGDDLEAAGFFPIGRGQIPIAIRSGGEHTDLPGMRGVPLPAAAPLQDLGPLVFGGHALHLQQQLIFGGLLQFPVQKDHRHSRPLEFLEQQDLISVFARQAIGGMDVELIDAPRGRQIPQPLQRGAHQGSAAIPFVPELPFRGHGQPRGGHPRPEGGHLTFNGVRLGLLIGRNAGINCGLDRSH